MRKKHAVYIVGGSFQNKGAEAMLLTVGDAIRQRFPQVDILVRIPLQNFTDARINGMIPVWSDAGTSVIAALYSKVRTARTYYRSCALVDIGGYQFGDPWGDRLAWKRVRSVKRCARLGNLIFFMPQTWGPFSSVSLRNAVRSVVKTATLCYARDGASLENIEAVVGRESTKVRFGHDVAWNFQGAETSVGQQLLFEAGLRRKTGSLTICITPNLRVYERSKGDSTNNEYIAFIAELISHLWNAHHAQVVLLGHELRSDNTTQIDDRTLCNYVLALVDKSFPVVHIDKVLSAREAKSVFRNCDIVLSSRYHALIASLSQGVSAIAMGWAHKYEELLSEVGLESNIIWPLKQKTSRDALSHLDGILQRLEGDRQTIQSCLGAIKKNAQDTVDHVLSRIAPQVGI